MEGLFESFIKFGSAILILLLLVVIAIYIVVSVFINKFHKQLEGRGTIRAWIPVLNIYILGKFLLNKGFGWGLVIAQIVISILTSTTTTTINDVTTTSSILPQSASNVINTIWGVAFLGLFVWAIVKFVKNKGVGETHYVAPKNDFKFVPEEKSTTKSVVEIVKYNDDDLKDDEIDEVVTRVRAFIVSSKNNMVVGFNNEGFQLLGGYVNAGEDLVSSLANMIYNECGIALDGKDKIEPFYEVRYYNRDYKGSGLNRLSDLIYFVVHTDKLPNHKRLKLTEKELSERLPLEIVRRGLFGKELRDYIEKEQNPVNKIKANELLMAYEKFKEIYKF